MRKSFQSALGIYMLRPYEGLRVAHYLSNIMQIETARSPMSIREISTALHMCPRDVIAALNKFRRLMLKRRVDGGWIEENKKGA
jgi:predicted DNA-binding transcriptional regulator